MKKVSALSIALIMFLAFSLAGCYSAPAASTKAGGSGSPTMDRILAAKKIKIGVSPGGPPIAFRDDKGDLQGYDVDFGKKLAETLGVKVEFVDVNGETRIPALTSGRVDIIFANITGNLERAKTIDFSIPYLKSGIKMITLAGAPFKTIEDLNKPDVKVVVGRGTTGEALVSKQAPKAQIIYVDGFPDQILQVQQSKADAAFEDNTIIDYAAKNSGGKLEAQGKQYSSDPICIGTTKGDIEFTRWLDMFVSWQITQGFQAATYEKWWGVKPAPLSAPW